MKKMTMASTAKKSAMYEKYKKAMIKKIRSNMPTSVGCGASRAVIVSLAAGLLAHAQIDGMMDECGKAAVRDMAHELHYTWDPFDGFVA